MSRVAVLLADGFEEIEAITIIDVLRRAQIDVDTVAVGSDAAVATHTVTGAHHIAVHADVSLAEASARRFDVVVLPGGMPGASTLRDDPAVQALLQAHAARGGALAAICAAPIALARAGLLHGKRATCFPGFEAQLGDAHFVDARVVVDGDIITSRGPGTAMAFALTLVERLTDRARREKLESGMLVAAEPA